MLVQHLKAFRILLFDKKERKLLHKFFGGLVEVLRYLFCNKFWRAIILVTKRAVRAIYPKIQMMMIKKDFFIKGG
jgi:hypothetical protein